MRIRMIFLALMAFGVIGLGASGSVAAGQRTIAFLFRGELIADPPSGRQLAPWSTSLAATAPRSGSWSARAPPRPSRSGPNTQYLRWARGVPTVVSLDNLAEGDQLTIRIRAPRRSSLAQVESTPAARRLRPRAESRPRGEAALALQGDAQRSRFGRQAEHPRAGRQLPRLEGDARPGSGSVLRLQPAHDLHPLAGPSTDADLAEPAGSRRADQHPDPCPR